MVCDTTVTTQTQTIPPFPPTHINFAKTPYLRTDWHTDLKFGMWHHSDNPNSDFYDLLSILIIIKNVFMISFLKRRFWLTECDWKWWKIVIFHKLLQQKWWFYYVTLKIFKFSLFYPSAWLSMILCQSKKIMKKVNFSLVFTSKNYDFTI